MENKDGIMKHMSFKAYDYAMANGIYDKIVEGELDVSKTLEYFNVRRYATPCEAVKRKYEMIVNHKRGNREFTRHFAIYYAFLDIFRGIMKLACV